MNDKEDKGMENAIERSSKDLKCLLDKISNKLPLLTGKGKMIKLDKNNPDDVEWYNDEK